MTESKIDYKVGNYVTHTGFRTQWFENNPGPYKVTSLDVKGNNVSFSEPIGSIQVKAEWNADFFSKATPKADTYILVLKDGGGFLPASVPKTYTSEAQAKLVAAEMAEKRPGKEFVIFKAVGKAKAVAATVEMFHG